MQNPPVPPLRPGLGPAASAPFTEQVLPACNGQLDPRAAYTWKRAQILAFLAAVITTPAAYGVNTSDAPELARILDEIKDLCKPHGSTYNAVGLEPSQHISRTLNPAWAATPQAQNSLSKFRLSKHYHWGVPYWSPADLLGLFISKTGPAPLAATKRTFFLPLTAMFGRWVNELIGCRPYMYNCTWLVRLNGNAPSVFFLGASLTGYELRKDLVGKWPAVIRNARHRLVAGEFLSLNGWSFNNTPALEKADVRTKFGNCAETYPFVHFMEGYKDTNRDVHGLALQWKGIRPPVYQDSLSGETWKRLCDPCFNCSELIRIHGGLIGNFDRDSGPIGGPP